MGSAFGGIAAVMLSYPRVPDAWSFAKTIAIAFLVVWGAFAFVFRSERSLERWLGRYRAGKGSYSIKHIERLDREARHSQLDAGSRGGSSATGGGGADGGGVGGGY